MRVIVYTLAGILVLAGTASDADARKGARNGKSYQYGYQSSYPKGRAYGYGPSRRNNDSSMECIRANDADPGGDYSDYPCWAQWALSPKGRPGR